MKKIINWELPDSLISWIWGENFTKLRTKKVNPELDYYFLDNNRKYNNINRADRHFKGFKKLVVKEVKKRNTLRRIGFDFNINSKLHLEDKILLLDINEFITTKMKPTKVGYIVQKLKYQNPEYYFIFKRLGDKIKIWRINQKI